ncbi:aminoacylase-1-like [Neocloeon triangulifer]|uniref:aminoacylase-1-like n=1 Tax=Neocloeon triangulifer TaxID=2078957 RepID=UPI00286F0A10|nr:aminoacylase-1-like [Neocloeon triangulifer]
MAVEDSAVTNFREYLRIPSVHPNVNYDGCIEFLKKQAKGLDLPVQIFAVVDGKPIVVLTWQGVEPALPAVLLNSHMDVVPVFAEKWSHGPFAAEKDANGNIYARGSQDMKCVGIQYLEAIRRLKSNGIALKRTLHISFVPDEEIGGVDGMEKFVHTQDFKNLNIGFALDEGMASPNDEFLFYNGERCIWQLFVSCPGTPGHGSLMLPDTAGEKVEIIINKFMDLRRREKAKLESNKNLTVGDVTTVNLTQIKGGVQPNVVPPELTVGFDVRLATDVNHDEFEAMINGWCKEAGEGTYITYTQKNNFVPNTALDNSNPWWIAFKSACDKMKMKLKPSIFPGGTDSRYVREVGIPALGFSPIVNTPVLLHDHDEFLNEKVFLHGIKIYEELLKAVANA